MGHDEPQQLPAAAVAAGGVDVGRIVVDMDRTATDGLADALMSTSPEA